MTIGDNKTIYGGILIRTIKHIATGQIITGQCNCVSYMMKQYDELDINEFVKKFVNFDIFNNKNCVYIKKNNNNIDNDNRKIYSGPHVGLSLKYPEFLFKKYRFLKDLKNIPEYKNTIIATLHNDGLSNEDINKTTSISMLSIKKAVSDFDTGKTLNIEDDKLLTIKDINKLYGYYSTN